MQMTIDRDLCDHVLSECEQCLARLMRHPLGEDRPCITNLFDDGDPVLRLALKYDGLEQTFVLAPEDREIVALQGWSQLVEVMPRMYRG